MTLEQGPLVQEIALLRDRVASGELSPGRASELLQKAMTGRETVVLDPSEWTEVARS